MSGNLIHYKDVIFTIFSMIFATIFCTLYDHKLQFRSDVGNRAGANTRGMGWNPISGEQVSGA